jgi:hypothetical protein
MFECFKCFKKKNIYQRIINILIWQNIKYRENNLNGENFIQLYDKNHQMHAIIYFDNNNVIISKYLKIDFLKIYKNLYYDEKGIIKNDISYITLEYKDKTDSYIYSTLMNYILNNT